MFKVILSSPLGFPGTTIKFEKITFPANLNGCVSYVGHPATKSLLEKLGAEYVPGKYNGPEIGESFLAVPLMTNNRDVAGFTTDEAIDDVESLKAILCTRVA